MTTPPGNLQQEQSSSIWGTVQHYMGAPFRAAAHYAGAPVRGTAGNVVSGAVDQLTTYWQENRPELIEQVRDVFSKAMLAKSPPPVRNLYQSILSVLQVPTGQELERIHLLLPQINALMLQQMAPQITQEELASVLSTPLRFQHGVQWTGQAIVLTQDLRAHLDYVAGFLKSLIDRNDGVLVQCMQFANDSLAEAKQRLMGQFQSAGNVGDTPLPLVPPPDGEQQPPAQGLNGIIDRGGQFLNSLVSMGSNAISTRAASALATLFHLVLEQVRGGISKRDAAHPLLAQIDPLIGRLSTSIKAPSWEVLIATLQETLAFLRQQHIYFQGFKVPLLNNGTTHLSAIPPLLQNISSHKALLHRPSFEEGVTDERMAVQASILKANLSAYISMSLSGRLIHWGNAAPIDVSLFQGSSVNEIAGISQTLRTKYFQRIDRSRSSFVMKWVAKRSYDLVNGFASFYGNSIIEKVFSLAKKFIGDELLSPDAKQELIIKTLRNWLAVTSGAYNQAAEAPPSQAKDLLAMIEEMIKLPARNDGMTQKQVYAALLESVLDQFGPKIQWTSSIDSFFTREIPSTSRLHFLNPLVVGVNFFLATSIKTMVILPQWMSNVVIKIGTKVAARRADIVQDYVEQKVDSLKRNTPTSYAMQKVIYHQLQNVLKTIEEKLGRQSSGNEDPTLNLSHARKHEIAGLVKIGLEVLNKCRYLTKDDLFNFLQHKAPLKDRLIRELEETFLPQVLETAATTLSLTLKTVTSQTMLRQSLYEMLCVTNESFGSEGTVTDAEFLSIQKGISELRDQLLEATTLHAVEELLDFTNAKQQRDLDQFMTEFKGQSLQFTCRLQHELYETTQILNNSSLPLQAKITELVEMSIQFHNDRLNALSKADGNRNLHTSTKQDLNVISQEMINHSTPLAGSLNEMKRAVDQAASSERFLPDLSHLQTFLGSLQPHLHKDRLSPEEKEFCTIQLDLAQVHMNSLREKNFPLVEQNSLELQLHQLRGALDAAYLRQKEKEALQEITWQMMELQYAKRHHSPTAQIQELNQSLHSKISTLSFPDHRRTAYECLQALAFAQTEEAIHSAAMRWQGEHYGISCLNDNHIQSDLNHMRSHCASLQHRLHESSHQYLNSFAQAKHAIQNLLQHATVQAQHLYHWSNHRAGPNLWNIMPFDMHWVTETVKSVAFLSAQDKMQMLLDTLHLRHNIIGFMGQVGIHPWLRYSKAHAS
ncbi:MAG: hypothetical protein V4492_03105 [Chlamydiota bacterium]